MYFIRNIGLEGQTENLLSSYTFLNSGTRYEINEDSSQYCQSTLKSLTVGQKQICLLHADHMPIVIQGIFFYGISSVTYPTMWRMRISR
jgi:hypothetical protein